MEQINSYILQARLKGQPDEQSREALIAAGWDAELVKSALGEPKASSPTPAAVLPSPYQPQTIATQPSAVIAASLPSQTPLQDAPKGRLRGSRLIAVGIVVLLLLAIGITYGIFGQRTTYKGTIQNFISAMEDKNMAKADSLESPALQSQLQKEFSTSSFYTFCKQSGQFCTSLFESSFLDKASKTYKSYEASNGTKGEAIVYSLEKAGAATAVISPGCSSNSTSTLTIAAVPKGGKWLIDNVDPSISYSSNLCPPSAGS